MIHPRTKHASNYPKGESANPSEALLVFKLQLFKNEEIQKTWLSDFREWTIIIERDFNFKFSLKYYRKILKLVEALGWKVF